MSSRYEIACVSFIGLIHTSINLLQRTFSTFAKPIERSVSARSSPCGSAISGFKETVIVALVARFFSRSAMTFWISSPIGFVWGIRSMFCEDAP